MADTIFDPCIGYTRSQRHRLVKEGTPASRAALVAEHGFDTKFAGHMLRVAYQGIELAETGRMEMPMREPMRSRILDVRHGRVPLADVLAESEDLEAKLVQMRDSKVLGPPNREAVESFVIDTYLSAHAMTAASHGSGEKTR